MLNWIIPIFVAGAIFFIARDQSRSRKRDRDYWEYLYQLRDRNLGRAAEIRQNYPKDPRFRTHDEHLRLRAEADERLMRTLNGSG